MQSNPTTPTQTPAQDDDAELAHHISAILNHPATPLLHLQRAGGCRVRPKRAVRLLGLNRVHDAAHRQQHQEGKRRVSADESSRRWELLRGWLIGTGLFGFGGTHAAFGV
ncbi:MAG: hypothetical protein H0W76_18340 [Pyrinomonadaceae bacterium]|nr:hypothetical protein [Pyrinomonadaceae bacterium]